MSHLRGRVDGQLKGSVSKCWMHRSCGHDGNPTLVRKDFIKAAGLAQVRFGGLTAEWAHSFSLGFKMSSSPLYLMTAICSIKLWTLW
jgi:hypothetical protein